MMIHKTQEENWRGLLPIQLSLSPSSLSSPSMPPPLFKLVPRHSFLHIALKEEIQRLYAYAPSMMVTSSEFKTVVEQMDDDEGEEKERDDSCTTQHCATTTVTTANNDNAVSSSIATDAEKMTTAQEQDDASTTTTTTTTTTLETSLVAATADPDADAHTSSNKNTKESSIYKSRGVIPLCWFMDQETNTPLRWHLFIGVLYDRLHNNSNSRAAGYNSTTLLPWKIIISFTSYPTEILLPLPESPPPSLSLTLDSIKSQSPTTTVCAITKTVNQIFTNSFKQALFLQYHSNRMALSGMTKQMHQQLWSSLIRNKYELYRPIQEQVMYTQSMTVESNSTVFRIPVGIFINDHPLKVRPSLPFLPPRPKSQEENDTKNIETQTFVTLGHYLFTNLPSNSFHLLNENEEQVDESKHYIHNPTILETNTIWIPLFTWTIQGIQNISLTLPLVELWRALCHPDHFLYIIISLNAT